MPLLLPQRNRRKESMHERWRQAVEDGGDEKEREIADPVHACKGF